MRTGGVLEGERARAGRSRFLVQVTLIALVGFVIRLADVGLTWWGHKVGGDAAYYRGQALALSHGHVFVEPFVYQILHRSVSSAAHPPLFTLVLSGADLLHLSSVDATRVLCCAIGAVGVVLVGLLGREVAGPRAGLIAAGLAAVYPVWWMTDGLVLAEVLYMPLAAGVLLCAYRLWRRPRALTAAGMGALGALAGLTRSEGVLLLVLVAVPVLFLQRALSWSRRLQLLGVTLVVAGIVLAPWVVFNATRFDKPVYLSTNEGATAADANCPATYHGEFLGGYMFGCHTPKVAQTGDESDVSHELAAVGVRYARRHLSRVPVVVAARIGRTWGVFRPMTTLDADSFGKWSHGDSQLMLGSYYVVAIMGLAGLVVLRRRRVTIMPFVAAILTVTVTVGLFYGIARFRTAGDLALVVLAAVALDALVGRYRARDVQPGSARAEVGGGADAPPVTATTQDGTPAQHESDREQPERKHEPVANGRSAST